MCYSLFFNVALNHPDPFSPSLFLSFSITLNGAFNLYYGSNIRTDFTSILVLFTLYPGRRLSFYCYFLACYHVTSLLKPHLKTSYHPESQIQTRFYIILLLLVCLFFFSYPSLFFAQAKLTAASGPLDLLMILPGIIFLQIFVCLTSALSTGSFLTLIGYSLSHLSVLMFSKCKKL